MRTLPRTLAVGVLAGTLAACSSSDDGASNAPIDDRPGVSLDDTSDTADASDDTDGTSGGTSGTTGGTSGGTAGTTGGTSGGTSGTTGGTAGTDGGTNGRTVGNDVAGCDYVPDTDGVEIGEYNRVLTEALSLGGPSRTDGNCPEGPPSAPTDLTALLIADNWVEFTWTPSADNGAIVAYEIYRDGQLVGTVDDEQENNTIEEQRSWRTTSYIDCQYTKDINCETVGQPMAGTSHEYRVVAIDSEGEQSAASEPATFTMNTIEQTAAPDPASENYTLTFEDNFDGNALDRDKWRQLMPWGPEESVNGEMQYFYDHFGGDGTKFGDYNPFVLNDGILSITGIPTPEEYLEAANGKPYLSGVLTNRDKFDMLYGYVEMRAKVPAGKGLLSTFFLLQPNGNQYEIDILEFLGELPNAATQNYHYRDGFRFADNGLLDFEGNSIDTGFRGVAHAAPTMYHNSPVDLSEGFHTYSVLWEPELVIWYIDGIEVRRMSGPRVPDQPLNIVAQLVIGSDWIGDPAGNVTFPVSYDIDYMRIWQK